MPGSRGRAGAGRAGPAAPPRGVSGKRSLLPGGPRRRGAERDTLRALCKRLLRFLLQGVGEGQGAVFKVTAPHIYSSSVPFPPPPRRTLAQGSLACHRSLWEGGCSRCLKPRGWAPPPGFVVPRLWPPSPHSAAWPSSAKGLTERGTAAGPRPAPHRCCPGRGRVPEDEPRGLPGRGGFQTARQAARPPRRQPPADVGSPPQTWAGGLWPRTPARASHGSQAWPAWGRRRRQRRARSLNSPGFPELGTASARVSLPERLRRAASPGGELSARCSPAAGC